MKLKINTILEKEVDNTFPSDLTILNYGTKLFDDYLKTVEPYLRRRILENEAKENYKIFFVNNERVLVVIYDLPETTKEAQYRMFYKIYDYVRNQITIINTITNQTPLKTNPKEWAEIVLNITKRFNRYNETAWHTRTDLCGQPQPEPDFSRSYLCTKEITFIAD